MTKNSMALNRTLFLEDNLPVLRGLDSDSIDLIATDPPFNKGVPAFEGTTKAGQNVEFKDVWNWNDDVHVEWTNAISGRHPSLYAAIDAANRTAGYDMGAFLCWMGVRVLEMHRVLKPTGSLYLHCDQTASHYLKAMLDAIFGRKNFRNEIIWSYRTGGVSKRYWPRKHDSILFYVKSDSYEHSPIQERIFYDKKFFTQKVDAEGNYYADVYVRDVWDDIKPIINVSKERTGYPTQKPLALYKRMIEASSNPDDMVLDPFAGCATTCVAAEQLERQWIGIDIQEKAGDVIRERLENEVNGSMAWDAIVRTPTEAPERTDGGEPADPELMLVSPKRTASRMPIREVRERLIIRDGRRCQGCGWEPQWVDYLQIDHNRPKTLGGEDAMDNYALLCDPCNRKKSNKLTLHELRIARAAEGRIDTDWWEEEKWER